MEILTDAQVQEEIENLKKSEYVKLAAKEIRLKTRKRKYLYQLRWMEKRGKELAESGFDGDLLEALYDGLDME